MFIRFAYLLSGYCLPGVQPVNMVSKTTSRGLSARDAACFYGFDTCLQGTVSKGCSLFIWFLSPPSRRLSVRGAACLYIFQTYLQETVSKGCSLFIWFMNLSSGDCQPGMQPVYTFPKLTSRGLSSRGAACLNGFLTYLQGLSAGVSACL